MGIFYCYHPGFFISRPVFFYVDRLQFYVCADIADWCLVEIISYDWWCGHTYVFDESIQSHWSIVQIINSSSISKFKILKIARYYTSNVVYLNSISLTIFDGANIDLLTLT